MRAISSMRTSFTKELLPFRVWQIYKAMVGFASSDRARFIVAAGVLAHCVGEIDQYL